MGGVEMTVTKAQLVERVIGLGVPEKTAKMAVQKFIDSIVEALKKGEKAQISGFGCFKIKERRARIGRNPKTGAVVNVPVKKVPIFRAAEELKEAVK